MPPKKKNAKDPSFIDWRRSKAKCILIEDLISGRLPLDESYMSAEAAWDVHYQHLPEFKRVVFKQFKERLKDHRVQVYGDLGRARKENAAVSSHRLHFPRSDTTEGKPVFDLHPAKDLLREDIKEKKHIGMKPSAFRLTREEYKAFDPAIFRRRIYQEIRRQKFIKFLNDKRENEGKLMRCEPPPENLYDVDGVVSDDEMQD